MDGLSAQQRWILQPLTDAGLSGQEVGDLLFRLAFATTVDAAGLAPLGPYDLAADRPAPVRRAWLVVLERLTAGPAGPCGPAGTAPNRNEQDRDGVFPGPTGG